MDSAIKILVPTLYFSFLAAIQGALGGIVTVATTPSGSDNKVYIKAGESVTFTATATPDEGTVDSSGYKWTFPHGTVVDGDTSGAGPIVVTFGTDADGQKCSCTIGVTHNGPAGEPCQTNDVPALTIDVSALKIDHKTKYYTDRTVSTGDEQLDRTTIGIGEEVICKLLPESDIPSSSLTWRVSSGIGTVDDVHNPKTTYTTGFQPGTETVEVEIARDSDSIKLDSDLTVIAPNSVFYEVGQVQKNAAGTNTFLIEAESSLYLGPSTVNFYNIKMKETTCSAITSGYFSFQEGLAHNAWPVAAPMYSPLGVVDGKGTYVNGTETSSTGIMNVKPYYEGDFVWNIPHIYIFKGVAGDICEVQAHIWITKDTPGNKWVLHLNKEFHGSSAGGETSTVPIP